MPAKLVKTKTPGVYKRGSRYVIRYRYRGEERKRFARTYAEARDLKSQIQADIARGEHHRTPRTRFEDYAREWIDSYTGRTTRGFREATRVGYRRTLEQKAIPYFSKRRPNLSEIEPRDVRLFITWLFDEKAQGRRLAVSTVRQHVAALRALLATAVEDGLIRHNPASGVRISRPGSVDLPQEPGESRRALDSDQLARFLMACEPEWREFFELLAMTGLRISEATELRWKDVDLGAKRLRVRRRYFKGDVAPPKSRYGARDVPLSTNMCRQLWSRQRASEDLLFTGPLGERIERDWLWRNALKPAAKAAGVPWVGFHTFRHTCASMLFANGKNAKVVQEWLGHSDPGFTLRTYIHLLDDGLGDADFLDGAKWATQRATQATQTQANAERAERRKTAS